MMDLPYPKLACDNYANYIDLLQIEADWIIYADEDAFAFRPERIQNLLEYMEARNFALCGMPDGGVSEHRMHNPVACNPFFNIINRKLIREALNKAPIDLKTPWQESYRCYTAPFVGARGKAFVYDNFEPFYGLYFWFCEHGFDMLYLDAETWEGEPERLSTILKDHTGTPFLLHTWFARDYKGAHHARINRAIEYASALKEKYKIKNNSAVSQI